MERALSWSSEVTVLRGIPGETGLCRRGWMTRPFRGLFSSRTGDHISAAALPSLPRPGPHCEPGWAAGTVTEPLPPPLTPRRGRCRPKTRNKEKRSDDSRRSVDVTDPGNFVNPHYSFKVKHSDAGCPGRLEHGGQPPAAWGRRGLERRDGDGAAWVWGRRRESALHFGKDGSFGRAPRLRGAGGHARLHKGRLPKRRGPRPRPAALLRDASLWFSAPPPKVVHSQRVLPWRRAQWGSLSASPGNSHLCCAPPSLLSPLSFYPSVESSS